MKAFFSPAGLIIYCLLLVLIQSCRTDPRDSGSFIKKEEGDYPILILTDGSDFGFFTAEILKAEGLNEFTIDSLTSISFNPGYLNQFDIVVLCQAELSGKETRLIRQYVAAGGNLVAFRPDKKLSAIFGLSDQEGSLDEGYIMIDTSHGTGRGLVAESLQFHGTADLYKCHGSIKLASFCSDALKCKEFPAVVKNSYKKGRAAAFTYNLPKSIVYTRQGNPEWAGEERDMVDGPTSSDLFFPKPGEKQWNDPAKIAIPQADEQMRLLTRIIEEFSSFKKPLPRLWYFPDLYSSIFIFTIDGENNTGEEIDSEIMDVQGKGGHATLYQIGTYISLPLVRKWTENGHEVAVHYNNVPNYKDPTYASMIGVFDTMTSAFREAYGYSPETVRNHWVVWCSKDSSGRKEFAQQALIEESYGIGFDCNYYQFGGNQVYPNWMGDVGHFNGSGIPMKFSDTQGGIINVYQSNTQLPDETWLKENIEAKGKLLIDRSIDHEYYAFINANFHTWYWKDCRDAGLKLLDHCNERGIPVWTAKRVYDFLKMKDEASFSRVRWTDNQLSFELVSHLVHENGLTVMLPEVYKDLRISKIIVNDEERKLYIRKVKGSPYAMITVRPGRTHRFIVLYS